MLQSGANLWQTCLLTYTPVSFLGKMPYSGLGGMEVVEFIKSGKRLTKPDGCPDKM